MDDDIPIYDVVQEKLDGLAPSDFGPPEGYPQYDKKQAEAMVGKMLIDKQNANAIGKVTACHGYQEQKLAKPVYALDVKWNRKPEGYTSTETMLFRYDTDKRFEQQHGLHAKVAERQWLHDQLVKNEISANRSPRCTP